MGNKVLTIVQAGLEAVNGTAVAADTRLVAEVALPDSDRELVVPGAGTGKRVPEVLDNAYYRRLSCEGITLTTPDGAYFQLLPLLLSSCVDGNITPVEQTPSEGDYLWTFTESLTGTEDLDTFTLEVGDQFAGNSALEIAYCIVKELSFIGNAETGEMTISATIDGDKLTPTTLTSVATLPTFEPIHGKKVRLFIDSSWATLGNTEVTGTLLDFTVPLIGGGHHKRRGDSALTPGAHGQDKVEMMATLGLEHNAAAIAEEALYYADTTTIRYIRLQVEGAQIGAGDNHTLVIDMAGVWQTWAPFTNRDQDGNTISVGTLKVGYDVTGTRAFNIAVTTDVAAI
jgi:hypothetical protein